jgi:hypothetical protein
MKKPYTVILIFLLTTLGKASDLGGTGELATSFKQAAARAEAQHKIDAAILYEHRDLMPYYEKKYFPVFQSCLVSTDHPDPSPVSFIVAIGKDGRVLRLYVDHETNIFACVRPTLQQDEFPHPPLSPYYMRVSMNFSNAFQ